ncbi:ARM repeat-containing protein [Coemansia reversa NRRL 1564]|uniref:ARM repeat-containing protein n=1 Tax=Coemansia reversa (strain ATCC 12441 / NRRL 1564) TaxID=763665 RepID=A0A2G5B593_COERN|nr:ARM repeat-containing protein [Coemansia reversa NRRL 1564]|eukprot:PIA14179.1 ARM repeat-containing protein [Coemansia reversa NRRL 1564]
MSSAADTAEFAAGARLAQDLVLVGNDNAASLLLNDAYDAIDAATLAAISAEDVQVWQTPPDQLHTDPLANQKAAGATNSKKGDAWVEQMQREAAQRKGQAPKLSRTEQELVAAQQAQEREVRQRVDAACHGLQRGLALARAVISSSLIVAAAHMPALVRAVVGRAIVDGGRGSVALAGVELAATLQAIGEAAEGLEPELRTPLAMALLRARGLESAVPARWMQETMQDLATRLLFRLRVGSAASPLPPAGFAFVLPFAVAVADAGGWGQRTSKGPEEHDEYAQVDPSAEQLAMVADIVATHAPLGRTSAAPRREMIELLIQLMADHPTLLPASRAGLERLAAAMEGTDTPNEYNALLAGLTRPDSAVRAACLAALDYVDLTAVESVPDLWLNTGGVDTGDAALEENARLALALWEDSGLQAQKELIAAMVPFLGDKSAELRTCAARALAAAVRDVDESDAVADALQQLQDAYAHWHISLEPDYDEYGIVVPGTQNRTDPVDARVGVADALCHVAPLLENAEQAETLLRFLVRGRALGERAEPVRVRMLAAGVQVAESHGAQWAGDLLPLLERVLAERDRGTATQDHVREGVIVLLGRLAQHLPADEAPRVAAAVERLLAALATPSEPVQRAVGQCLPPLARRLDDASHAAAVERLLKDTLDAPSYARRRGAAFGLAGMLKGRGLGALKAFRVVDRLRDACGDSVPAHREGALFAVAALAEAMGRLFEPYAVQMVPLLLTLFADHAVGVRNAASEAARAIMANLSAHGVRLVMPATLQALADDRWRTKKASVDMLGAMAYCAPRQLSVSLPAVVPRIVDALTDAHAQVADSARAALQHFGDVIHNPELQRLVPELLAALDDPAATDAALRALLFTAFVHYIDAPSLALLIPVLQRAMRARAAATKRNAAQIVGSMAALTEPTDLAPYLPDLLPLLRAVLVDPVPETRATSAKALGSLVRSLREPRFPTLVADLIAVLKSDASAVDRAGAAQGLSEVLSAVGLERMERLLPEVVANCSSSRVAVREGFMLLLVYLPTTFAEEFQPFLPRVLPPVLSGLADENEQVRSAALRAGRILVASFAGTSVDLLIPELLSAMHNGAWRIRQSSIELLAELIFRIAGVSAKHAEREREAARAAFGVVQDSEAADDEESDLEEDSGDEDEENDAAIISNLREILSDKIGVERCHQILAALYVARSDVATMVRQASFSVWKSIVSNTPRTVRECLPSIMEIVLAGLASSEYERRATAARTLGDLVHKLGEAVMSRVVPILKDALRTESSSDAGGSIRHGVFIGLAEILSSTGKAHIDAYADAIIPLVRRGLCDQDDMVREAAAGAFNGLQQSVGPRVIDSVVPPLLNALTKDSSSVEDNDLEGINPEHALEALRELMAVRASVVFPVLIPTLTAVPVSAFNARALSSLIQVSGQALSKRLPQILLALFQSLPVHHAAGDQDAEAALRDTVRAIVAAAAQDENTLDSLMMLFHESVKVGEGSNLEKSPKDASRVAEACFAFGAMCQAFGPNSAARGRSELGSHVVDWLRILISLLASNAMLIVEASWTALEALCKTIPKDDYDGYVGPVSRAVQQATDSLPHGQKTLPGFNLPKGIGPLLPIYAQGLLAGSPSTKERAVRGMARMVRFTDSAALRPFATGITGPLIRIVGDRHPPVVKAAILSTLGLLLNQIPGLMRPFLPQLQRTFVRALFEQDEAVRRRAAAALAALIPLQTRLDPLVSELTAGIKQTADQGMKNAMMRAICAVVKAPNANSLSPASIQAIENTVTGRVDGVESSESANDIRWQTMRSQAFGGLCGVVPEDAALRLVTHHAVADQSDPPMLQATKLRCLAAVLAESPALFAGSSELQDRISESVQQALTPSDNAQQSRAVLPAVHVAKIALLNSDITPRAGAIVAPLLEALIRVVDPATMSSFDSDAQHAALGALKSLAKHRFVDIVEPMRDNVVQAAMAHVRDRNITVKLAAERCALYSLRLARVPIESFDGSEAGLKSYADNMGGPASEKGKQVMDYHRRVLSKLAESTRELDFASDDEDDPAAGRTINEGEESSDEDA